MKPYISYHVEYGHIIEENKERRPKIQTNGERIIYKQENIEEIFRKLLEKSLEEYNAKQYRADRKKTLSEIMLSRKAFREVTVKIEFTNPSEKDNETARTVLNRYMQVFEERNPNLKIFYAEMIVNEKMPLLRIDFIPICHGHFRGLSTAVSFRGALKEQGCHPVNKRVTEQIMWACKERAHIETLINQWQKKNKVERG